MIGARIVRCLAVRVFCGVARRTAGYGTISPFLDRTCEEGNGRWKYGFAGRVGDGDYAIAC